MRRFACVLLVVALGAVTAVTMTGGASAATKAPQLKIILLAETKGESSAAVPYYADGATMAANQLGAKVSLTRIPAPLTPAAAQTALLQAIDQKPDVIIGFPASSQIIAVEPTIASSGIPLLTLSSGEQLTRGQPSSAPNMVLIRPVDTLVAKAEADYVVKDLKAKKIGLVCVQNATGVNGCNAAHKVIDPLASKGVSVTATAQNGIADTDLSQQANAMKGVDAILDYNFPNPLAALANALVAQGVNVPNVDGASSSLIANGGLVKGGAATNLKGVDDCTPAISTNARVKKWASDYNTEFGYQPIYSAAEVYDMVNFLAAVTAKVGSTSPSKLLKGIATTSYNGICGSYKEDSIGVLLHSAVITKFDSSGAEGAVRTITFPAGQLPFTVVTTTTAAPAAPTTTAAK
jgi:ABC-type branched-subunit amino acid transport system substrate-binding protein